MRFLGISRNDLIHEILMLLSKAISPVCFWFGEKKGSGHNFNDVCTR